MRSRLRRKRRGKNFRRQLTKTKLERKKEEEDPNKRRRNYDHYIPTIDNIYIEDMGYKEVQIDVTVN